MSGDKFDNMFQLLSDYNFQIDENIPDALKCGKCAQLLINSYMGPCLCKFCGNCFDEMLNSGIEQCPGAKTECRDEQLCNFMSDNHSNFQISKLILTCPERTCSHKCQILKMEEHIRLCSNKGVQCPFYGLGCTEEKLVAGQIGDHLQLEGYNHNKILIDMLENLRNEVNLLKQSDEINKIEIQNHKDEIQRNRGQIEILKGNLRMKDERIASMVEEIQSNKNQIEQLKENSRMKNGTIAVINKDIKLLKMDKQEMASEINNLKTKSQNKIVHSREEMKKEYQDNLRRELKKINDEMQKWQLQITKRTDEVKKWLDKQIVGSFSWTVDQISDKRQKHTRNTSPIFYTRINPYKMQLLMVNDAGSDELCIRLYIHAGEIDAYLKWPFQGNVTIKISNKAHPNASKSMTKYCNIQKPNSNSYNVSELFTFSFQDLSNAGLTQDNYFNIGCRVE